MPTRHFNVERFSLTSSKPFDRIVASIEKRVARPDMRAFFKDLATAGSAVELELVILKASWGSDFMEFARYDMGEILRKENGPVAPRTLRLVLGDPLIMKQMVVHTPDAASYAPATVLIDERADGTHLSYDRMASLLAPYNNDKAIAVAQQLDLKIEALLSRVAS